MLPILTSLGLKNTWKKFCWIVAKLHINSDTKSALSALSIYRKGSELESINVVEAKLNWEGNSPLVSIYMYMYCKELELEIINAVEAKLNNASKQSSSVSVHCTSLWLH